MSDFGIDLDDQGWPIILAEPKKDAGDSNPLAKSKVPDPSLYQDERRGDAVREIAREFETFTEQDIIESLRGRINRPFSAQDVKAFWVDVRAQQISDLIDILDQIERGSLRGRRHVRVVAPRGYVKKTIGALTDEEIQSVADRLRGRGWNQKQMKGFADRLPEEKRHLVAMALLP